ncbi:MAG: hypothetical protein HYY06_17400 [Deltaproteobacteria bacterium]|nr:hypothetical protein [Deltaproteobacteria bacterium]
MRKIGSLVACAIIVLPAFAAAQNTPMPPPAEPMQPVQPGPADQNQMPPPAEAQSPWVTDQAATDQAATDQAAPADDAPAEDEAPAPTEPVRKGLGLQGSLGLSDCTGENCSDGDRLLYEGTSVGIGGEVVGVFRPIPLIGLGAGLHYNIVGVDDMPAEDNSMDYVNIELGARLYPISNGPVDISFGPTFGYTFAGIKSEDDSGELTRTLKGWTVGGQVGGEYFLAPLMSAGLSIRLWKPFWSEYCEEGDLVSGESWDDCEDVNDLEDDDQDDLPQIIWYVGGSFTYHIQM